VVGLTVPGYRMALTKTPQTCARSRAQAGPDQGTRWEETPGEERRGGSTANMRAFGPATSRINGTAGEGDGGRGDLPSETNPNAAETRARGMRLTWLVWRDCVVQSTHHGSFGINRKHPWRRGLRRGVNARG
jgi:hypothetical protein